MLSVNEDRMQNSHDDTYISIYTHLWIYNPYSRFLVKGQAFRLLLRFLGKNKGTHLHSELIYQLEE